jgi:hypothetical protein
VVPADPGRLIRAAQPYANDLRQRLKLANKPEVSRRDDRGRVIPRVVARVPDAQKPFKDRTAVESGLAPTVFVWVGLDSSGSMELRSKWEKAKVACMAVSLACQATGVHYLITMSRTTVKLAGEGIRPERGNCLIAGADYHRDGDNYANTLPAVSKQLQERKEAVKIALIITDGVPNCSQHVKVEVDRMRGKGMITIGVGLDLVPNEATGLQDIFGERDCVFTLEHDKGNFAILLSHVLNTAVRKGKALAR